MKYDAAIVGGGPAGLSAAIYLSRAGLTVAVLEKEGVGGQMASTYEVANYPGVLSCSGYELAQVMKEQAASFGTHFLSVNIRCLERVKDGFLLSSASVCGAIAAAERTDESAGNGDKSVQARGVILAMGAVPRKAGFTGEAEYAGRGVSYCAACDGAFFRGREIFVIGGGVAAVEESLFLTRFAKKVTLIVRRGRFSCPQSVYSRLSANEKIEVCFHTQITAVSGEDMITEIHFRTHTSDRETQHPNSRTDDRDTARTEGSIREWTRTSSEGFGVFVLAGRTPETSWLPDAATRDENGYLCVDDGQRTSLPLVYAAGDVCRKKLRQIATAVSDGAVAATELEKQLFS